jgi:hypothetical protein
MRRIVPTTVRVACIDSVGRNPISVPTSSIQLGRLHGLGHGGLPWTHSRADDATQRAVSRTRDRPILPSLHDAQSMEELSYVTMESKIHLRKGKWRHYSPEMERRIIDGEKERVDADRPKPKS